MNHQHRVVNPSAQHCKKQVSLFVPQNQKINSVHEWHYFVRLGSSSFFVPKHQTPNKFSNLPKGGSVNWNQKHGKQR